MKRAIALALGLAVVAGASYAQTNQVLSRNAVGYEKITVPVTSFVLVRMDFKGLSGNITISNAFSDQSVALTNGSSIVLYKKASQTYVPLTRARNTWPQGTTTLDTAEGFFLKAGTNFGNTNVAVYMMGEVPDSITAPTTIVANIGALGMPFQISGFGYPVDAAFATNPPGGPLAQLLNTLSNNSQIILFRNNQYIPFTKVRNGWASGLLTNVLGAGEAVFLKATNQNATWVQVKPYTWP